MSRRMRASGLTLLILRRSIGVISREGIGRVWSEQIITTSFLPTASSSRRGEPMGLSKDSSMTAA